MQWQGRVAIVTGAGSGIGRAVALRFRELGATVVACDFDPSPASQQTLEAHGVGLLRLDVRDDQQMAELVDSAAGHGRVDVLVNNAGITCVGSILERSIADWDDVMNTNFRAAFVASKLAIPHMRAGGGSIINISSNAGLLPRAHDPLYSTSKAALIALTKSLALCHAADRIRVNAICPGPVSDTRIMNRDLDRAADRSVFAEQIIAASPLARAEGRMITPEEVAETAVYLASDSAKMVTGTAVAIDGGKSLGVPPA